MKISQKILSINRGIRGEIRRRRELEAEMQRALIDQTLIERMHAHIYRPTFGFMHPLPEIDPAYRKGRTVVLGERAGY